MKKSNIKNILRYISDTSEKFKQVGQLAEQTSANFRNLALSVGELATFEFERGEK